MGDNPLECPAFGKSASACADPRTPVLNHTPEFRHPVPLFGLRMSRFEDFPIAEPILRAVREEGYERPTPIQQQTILHVLEGRDLLGCAQTGTGKTAAFALPILHRL